MHKKLFFLLTFAMLFGAQAGALSAKKIVNTAFASAGYKPTNVVVSESEAIENLISRAAVGAGLDRLTNDECDINYEYKEVDFQYKGADHKCVATYKVTTGNGILEYYVSFSLSRCTTDVSKAMAKKIEPFLIFSADLSSYETDYKKYDRVVKHIREMCEIANEDN